MYHLSARPQSARSWGLGLLSAPALALVLSGCGGGGGGGTSAPALGPLQVTGAVQTSAPAPGTAAAAMSGYTVNFDQNAKVAATTDANGAFTLTVPRASVTGTDTLYVYDPTGALVNTVVVPANTKTLTAFSAGTVSVSPPPLPPPANV